MAPSDLDDTTGADSGGFPDEARDEARRTLNQQIRKIENADQKAMSLFRSNIILLGLILTALSIVVQSNGESISEFINLSSILGVFFLLISTFLAAMAYTSSSLDVGIDAGIIERTDDPEYGITDLQADIKESYENGIHHNSNVGSFNATLITHSILCAFTAIILLLGGTVVGTFSMKLTIQSGLFLIALLVFSGILSTLIYYGETIFTRIFSR